MSSANISERAIAELQTAYLRIKPPMSAVRLWERVLSPADRVRLGGDRNQAFHDYGTVGMWQLLRGVSGERAVIDVARRLNLLDEATAEWLLREIGDMTDNPEEAIEVAIATGALVLVESPRAAYWEGQRIEIDWYDRSALWTYLWELARHSKANQSIDSLTFGDRAAGDYVVKQKSRLSGSPAFPVCLSDRIRPVGCGSQRLDLAPPQIRLFELETIETLRERTV